MIAMIEITKEMALALQLHSNHEVYELHDNSESLIEDSKEIIQDNDDARYGIEGNLIEVYNEGANK